MRPFDYQRVATLGELSDVLLEDPAGTRVLAGGTDLLVFLFDGKLQVRRLVDPKPIPGADAIKVNGGAIFGPTARLREIETSAALREQFPALAEGASEIGSVQIRQRGTLAGNLATSSPAADTPPALLAHGAQLKLFCQGNERTVSLAEFFTGPGRNVLQPGEVIAEIVLPEAAPRTSSHYLKLATRRAMDIAFVGVAGRVTLADDGTVQSAAVGLGAVAPTPLLVDLDELLGGRELTDEALAAAASATMAAASPISDQRCSAEYRRAMVGVLTKRTLREAAARAEAR